MANEVQEERPQKTLLSPMQFIRRNLRQALSQLDGALKVAGREIERSDMHLWEEVYMTTGKAADPFAEAKAKAEAAAKAMRCKTCMFCVPKGPAGGLGRCRRHAPALAGWPVVKMDVDWCGDHKLDETKTVNL